LSAAHSPESGRRKGRWRSEKGKQAKVGREWEEGTKGAKHTWLVQTLLKATKANVWASMAAGRSRLARARGMRTQERRSCGRKAMDSIWRVERRRAVAVVGRGDEAR
jgi:hypothetical protein